MRGGSSRNGSSARKLYSPSLANSDRSFNPAALFPAALPALQSGNSATVPTGQPAHFSGNSFQRRAIAAKPVQ